MEYELKMAMFLLEPFIVLFLFFIVVSFRLFHMAMNIQKTFFTFLVVMFVVVGRECVKIIRDRLFS